MKIEQNYHTFDTALRYCYDLVIFGRSSQEYFHLWNRTSIMVRPRTITVLLLVILLANFPPGSHGADGEANFQATFSQRTHPILIDHDVNILLHVTIDVKQSNVQVNSLDFSLNGTEDLNDIESLQLFYAGDKSSEELDKSRSGINFKGDRKAYAAKLISNSFGKKLKTASQMTFTGNQLLRPGKNIFWLSCKLNPNANLSHKVDALCKQIKTSSGNIQPVDQSPNIRKRIGFALRKHDDDGVHTTRIPAITRTPKGTLLAVYDLRIDKRRDLQENIDIGLSRSTDAGQTWEPVRVIMDMGDYGGLPQSQNGCSDPAIIVDQNTGEIICAAVWMWGKPGKHQWRADGSEPGFEIGKSAQFLMVRSSDDGLTWTKPENMTKKLKRAEWILLAPSPQAGITLRDGTLVMPVEGRDGKDRQFSTLITSSDHGKTWQISPSNAIFNGECQVVELDDGSLMLNGRTKRPIKFRSVWITKDRGKSWQPHKTHRKTLIEPNCNGSLLRFDYKENGKAKHVLIFANPHSQTGRNHQTVQVSFDSGNSWPKEYKLLLDEGNGNGYPSLTKVDDNHVGIVYEGSQAHLVFEKIPIKELLKHD
jgi:sialidase-1